MYYLSSHNAGAYPTPVQLPGESKACSICKRYVLRCMAAFQNLCIHIDVARGPAGPVLAGPLFSAEFFFLRGGGQLTIERTLAASTNHKNKHGYIGAR